MQEELDAEPLLAIPTGLQLDRLHWGHARYGPPPGNGSGSWAQDAADALAFATAPADASAWGALRARMGRRAPFRLARVEVGNEERTDDAPSADPETGYRGPPRGPTGEAPDAEGGYAARYRGVTSKLWERDAGLEVVATISP